MNRHCVAWLTACLLFLQSVCSVPVEPCPANLQEKECSDERLNGLMDWALIRGISAAKVQAGYANGMRGLIAKKRIKEKGQILRVPRASALILKQGSPPPFPELFSEAEWAQLPETFQLAALVLFEAKRGNQSDFHPWIQSLPTSFDTLVQWTSPELEELQLGSTLAEVDFRAEVDDRVRSGALAYDQIKHSSFAKRLGVTREDLNWALDVVTSRSVAVPPAITVFAFGAFRQTPNKGLLLLELTGYSLLLVLGVWMWSVASEGEQDATALLPVFDLLNHNSQQEGDWLVPSWTGSHLRIFAVAEGFEAGEEATISYGQKPNEAFLLHYGFVDTSYKYDFYTADLLEYVQQHHDISQERIAGLAQHDQLLQSLQSMALRKGGADRGVHKALRYLLVPEEELQQVAKESQGQWLGDYIEYRRRPNALTPLEYRLMSQPTELKVQQVLQQFCSSILERKATTIKADQAELAALAKQPGAGKQHQHKVLALQFRVGKKKILQSCVRKHKRVAQHVIDDNIGS